MSAEDYFDVDDIGLEMEEIDRAIDDGEYVPAGRYQKQLTQDERRKRKEPEQ